MLRFLLLFNQNMKRLTRAEYLLFAIPLLVFPIIWFARTVRFTSPPTPPPKPTPIPTPQPLTKRYNSWYSILASPDGKKIITGNALSSSGYGVQIWDAKSLQPLSTFGTQRGASPLEVTPDGKHIIVGWGGTNEKYALIYDSSTGKQVLQMPYGTGTTEFALSHNGKTLALGLTEHLELRELKTGRLLRRMRRWLPEPAASSADSPSFSSDGRRIAFVDDLQQSDDVYANGKRDEIGFFSVKSGRRLRVFGFKNTDIRNIAFSPDGRFLAVVAWVRKWPLRGQGKSIVEADRILLCDARTGRVRRTLTARPQMHALAFSPNGKWLAAGSFGEGVQVWNVNDGKLNLDRRGYRPGVGGDYVYSLDFMPNSRILLVGTKDNVRQLPMQ